MIVMRQPSRKKLQSTIATVDRLEQIYGLYISEAKWLSRLSISAAVLAIILLFIGLILWFDGKGPQGWIAVVPSPVILVLSKLLFDRYRDANKRVDDIRNSLEKRDEGERKKRELELEARRKKQAQEQEIKRKRQELEQEEDRKISYVMSRLEAYYKVSSKTDLEDKKEEYFHYLFGPIEYNKQQVETYFNVISFIEDEDAKKDFLREKFSSLLIAIDSQAHI